METTSVKPATGGKKGSKSKKRGAADGGKIAEARHGRASIEKSDSGPLTLDKYTCKQPKELRGESKRGKLLESLRGEKGITLAQGCTRFEWTPRDFADALRLLAKVNGVISTRDESGHWRVQSEPKPAPAK